MNTPASIGTIPTNGERLILCNAPKFVNLANEVNIQQNGRLKVLVIKEGSQLVAQCLQFDFSAHASNVKDLKHRLAHVLVSHIMVCKHLGTTPFSEVSKAPPFYWKEWERSYRLSNAIGEEDEGGNEVSASDELATYVTSVVAAAEFAIA